MVFKSLRIQKGNAYTIFMYVDGIISWININDYELHYAYTVIRSCVGGGEVGSNFHECVFWWIVMYALLQYENCANIKILPNLYNNFPIMSFLNSAGGAFIFIFVMRSKCFYFVPIRSFEGKKQKLPKREWRKAAVTATASWILRKFMGVVLPNKVICYFLTGFN